MNKKANMIVVIIIFILVLVLFALLSQYSSEKVIFKDNTRQAVTESELAVRKSVFAGVGKAMHEGLATSGKAWYCNRPFPPSYSEANISLADNTNNLLDSYFDGLRKEGYFESFDNLSYRISLPLAAETDIKVPGHSVIITDLSGSMNFEMDGTIKWHVVKDLNQIAVETAIGRTPGVKIGLVDYDENAWVRWPLTDDLDELEAAINSVTADGEGGTCIACGIYEAVSLLVPPPPPDNMVNNRPLSIVLMSDGGANQCHDENNILPECLLLNNPCNSNDDAAEQAIEYARQAHDLYNIDFYTVVFYSDPQICIDLGIPERICYDPITMQAIATAAGNPDNYYEGRNQDDLEEIYQRYGRDIARFSLRNLEYLKLENDVIYATAENTISGLDYEHLKSTMNITDEYTWNFKTWFLYKNLVTWLLHFGERQLLDIPKEQLTSSRACKAVIHDTTCPPAGEVYENFNATFNAMMLENKDLNPVEMIEEIEKELINFLNETRITCSAEFLKLNITNVPIFDFRTGPPNILPVNVPFGNASYKQTSTDGVTPRIECPGVGNPPENREDFLNIQSPYGYGMIGPDISVNPTCSAGTPYQYLAIDRILETDILISCIDPEIGEIMDGPTNFEPLTLEFIIRFDMMGNCELPVDENPNVLVC